MTAALALAACGPQQQDEETGLENPTAEAPTKTTSQALTTPPAGAGFTLFGLKRIRLGNAVNGQQPCLRINADNDLTTGSCVGAPTWAVYYSASENQYDFCRPDTLVLSTVQFPPKVLLPRYIAQCFSKGGKGIAGFPSVNTVTNYVLSQKQSDGSFLPSLRHNVSSPPSGLKGNYIRDTGIYGTGFAFDGDAYMSYNTFKRGMPIGAVYQSGRNINSEAAKQLWELF